MAGHRTRRLRSAQAALGYALLGATCLIAVGLCLAAPPRAPARALSPARAHEVASRIVNREASLRRRARGEFPGDAWSQDDAFHNLEQGLVRAAARREDVAIGSVLDALDAELRAASGEHKHTVAPCKPRPLYD